MAMKNAVFWDVTHLVLPIVPNVSGESACSSFRVEEYFCPEGVDSKLIRRVGKSGLGKVTSKKREI
jgi:hypothetical protein